jgi:hypothetical protein
LGEIRGYKRTEGCPRCQKKDQLLPVFYFGFYFGFFFGREREKQWGTAYRPKEAGKK